jgi:hypothetical protein
LKFSRDLIKTLQHSPHLKFVTDNTGLSTNVAIHYLNVRGYQPWSTQLAKLLFLWPLEGIDHEQIENRHFHMLQRSVVYNKRIDKMINQ